MPKADRPLRTSPQLNQLTGRVPPQPLNINDAVAIALINNRELALSTAALLRAQGRLSETRAAFNPTLTGGFTYTRLNQGPDCQFRRRRHRRHDNHNTGGTTTTAAEPLEERRRGGTNGTAARQEPEEPAYTTGGTGSNTGGTTGGTTGTGGTTTTTGGTTTSQPLTSSMPISPFSARLLLCPRHCRFIAGGGAAGAISGSGTEDRHQPNAQSDRAGYEIRLL